MSVWAVNLEILGLSTILVGVFATRRVFGLAPLYTCLGVLIAFLAIGGRLHMQVPIPGGSAYYTSLVHLSLILGGVVLVYALEGSRRARRLIVGLAIVSLFFLLLRWVLRLHLSVDGVDLSVQGRYAWFDVPIEGSLIGALAMLLDGLTIIVTYQALVNLWRGVPVLVAFPIALIAGMAADGVFYGAFAGAFDPSQFGDQLLGKVLAGASAGVPAALYISWQFRRHGDVDDGVRERKTLDIFDLRRELAEARAMMRHTRAQYDRVRNIFGRYVSPAVVNDILGDMDRLALGGERREVTVLFSDIRGYSTLSEQMTPEQTIDLLNEYFAWMTAVLDEHRGTIIEFEGDAILAIFNAPLDQADHAERAVLTALEMHRRVAQLNRHWESDGTADLWKAAGLDDFHIRIGVHTGPVVVGNLGSETRTKYGVIGDNVNVAARLESMNKKLGTRLLLSEATVSALGGSAGEVIDLGERPIRGRDQMIRVYTVGGLPRDEPLAG